MTLDIMIKRPSGSATLSMNDLINFHDVKKGMEVYYSTNHDTPALIVEEVFPWHVSFKKTGQEYRTSYSFDELMICVNSGKRFIYSKK